LNSLEHLLNRKGLDRLALLIYYLIIILPDFFYSNECLLCKDRQLRIGREVSE